MANKHQELLEFSTKWGVWVGYVLIGLMGKFGFDILAKKKISFIYVFATSCIAGFIGFLSSKWCMSHNPSSGPFVVPILTLVSRDCMLALNMINWQGIIVNSAKRIFGEKITKNTD